MYTAPPTPATYNTFATTNYTGTPEGPIIANMPRSHKMPVVSIM